MKKYLQNLKNKKGFTLVELIVVLVILAILAALLLPTLTRYIDKANEMKVESATRMAVMATKAEVGTAYGKLAAGSEFTPGEELTAASGKIAVADLQGLAELPLTATTPASYSVSAIVTTTGEVKALVYFSKTYTCVYEPDKAFTVYKVSDTTYSSVTLPESIAKVTTMDNKFVVKVKS